MEGVTKSKLLSFAGQFALIVGGVWVGMWVWTQSMKARTAAPAATAPPAPAAGS